MVGGGPAAATAARLLALWGRRVVVVARPQGDEPELPESLTPSCEKFFDLMGISAGDRGRRIRAPAAATRCGGATPEPRVEPFADGLHGWQATTGRLERGDARGRRRRRMRRGAARAL